MFHSDAGQDKWVLMDIYQGKKEGFYVDVGSEFGERCNNTFSLESAGWRGIYASSFPKELEKRTCKIVIKTVGDKIKNDTPSEVDIITLEKLLDDNESPKFIEYLSLDSKEFEYYIIDNFPFDKYTFGCITVKHNDIEDKRKQIQDTLIKNNYVLAKSFEHNDWYVNMNLSKLCSIHLETIKIKICFCAIFKNESKNVYRCLNSTKRVIDYISICDTGSTDNTIELIEKWSAENNVPSKIHREPFKDFGYNRNLSVKMAQESFPDATYLLLADADMILHIEENWDKTLLTSDEYLIKQKSSSLDYFNTRIIRRLLSWKCVGVTHEFWRCDTDHSIEKLDTLWFDDREDGGCKSDKFVRDKRLLTEGFNDPETPSDLKIRYMFYLGQTLRALGEHMEAIKWYRLRIEAGGWIEEIFYSRFQIGFCYQQMGKLNKACISWMETFNSHPNRSEPLYHLAKMYREIDKNHLALIFALRGKEIPYPRNDSLFVERDVYDYLFDEEISISAFYVSNRMQSGRDAIARLLVREDLPSQKLELAWKNAAFYSKL